MIILDDAAEGLASRHKEIYRTPDRATIYTFTKQELKQQELNLLYDKLQVGYAKVSQNEEAKAVGLEYPFDPKELYEANCVLREQINKSEKE